MIAEIGFWLKLKYRYFVCNIFFVSQGWWWWDKDNVLCSSFCKFLLKPKCKELCSSSHSCFNRVPFAQKIETFHTVVQFYTLSTYTIEFIAGVGSKTRWLKILRNLSFAPISEFSFLVSQFSRLELFLITFVRVTNLNSVLACLQQIKEMWVNRVGVPLADDPEEEEMFHTSQTNRSEGWQPKKQLCKSTHLVLIGRPGVFFEARVHPLSKLLHPRNLF